MNILDAMSVVVTEAARLPAGRLAPPASARPAGPTPATGGEGAGWRGLRTWFGGWWARPVLGPACLAPR